MRFRIVGVMALVGGLSAMGVALAAGGSVTFNDGSDQQRGTTTDIRKVTAKDAGSKIKWVIKVPQAQRTTKQLTYVLIYSEGVGTFYTSAVSRQAPDDKEIPRVGSRFVLNKKRDTLAIILPEGRIGSPKRIQFQVVSGGDGNEDYAPNRGQKTLRVG